MSRGRVRRGGETPTPSPPDLVEYLPEPAYFREFQGFSSVDAARITARCVAQWADRYEAWPVGIPSVIREGALPRTAAARAMVVREALDWVEAWLRRAERPVTLAGLVLRWSGRIVLDQHDGVPARLLLTPAQFAAMQNCLESEGLPRDLYYPASEARVLEEPVEYMGGVILGHRRYSPLQWARRDASNLPPLRLPSEEQQALRFFESCQRFLEALELRCAQLQRSDKQDDRQELQEVDALVENVGDLLQKVARRIAHTDRPAPPSGP